MLGDPVLWQTFYQAKDALIITNRYTLPGILPIELLQRIISFAVPFPDNHHTILRLSQVSKRFRDAVLDISGLFTRPDWTRWPVPLLELWCQRARTSPINITVYDTVFYDVSKARLRALLESCSSQWGCLKIIMYGPRAMDETVATGICNLLRCSAPSLHTLELYDNRPDSTGIQFALDCPPAFHTLHLYSMWPLLPASHTSVTDLTCECKMSRDWLRCQDVIRSCRLLQRLTLDFGVACVNMTTDPNMRATPVSVVHLELMNVSGKNVAAICQLLTHLDMPNLNSLSIRVLGLDAGGLYESLEHKFPDISILSVYTWNPHAIPHALNFLRRRPMKFPHLSELHLDLDYTMTAEIEQAIQDVLLLRKDTITRLTTRMPKGAAGLKSKSMRDHVQNLKLR